MSHEIKIGDKFAERQYEIEILFIGKDKCLVRYNNGMETSRSICDIKTNWTLIEPKRETIELFACLGTTGGVDYYDNKGRYPSFASKTMSSLQRTISRRIHSIPSVFIDAETFEIVEKK